MSQLQNPAWTVKQHPSLKAQIVATYGGQMHTAGAVDKSFPGVWVELSKQMFSVVPVMSTELCVTEVLYMKINECTSVCFWFTSYKKLQMWGSGQEFLLWSLWCLLEYFYFAQG